MKKQLLFILALFGLALTISCNQDDDGLNPETFEIESTEFFTVLSTYENGWINEARRVNGSGQVTTEFGYHENGYIKYYRIYESSSIDESFLSMEIERDENNLPVSSRFYRKSGELYLSLDYESGLIFSKEIFNENSTTLFQYQNGRVQSIRKESKDGNTLTDINYNYDTETRRTVITSSGETIFDEELFIDDSGFGVASEDYIPLAGFISRNDQNTTSINNFFGSSITEYFSLEAFLENGFVLNVPLVTDRFDEDENLKFITNSDLRRQLAEQYALVERKILIGGSSFRDRSISAGPNFEERDILRQMKEDDNTSFTAIYGDQYNSQNFIGRNTVVVAVFRNLPTDTGLRDRIIEIGKKQAENYTSDNALEIPEEDLSLLSRVFFEVKVHSANIENSDGFVVKSRQDMMEVEEMLLSAPQVVIERHYKSY